MLELLDSLGSGLGRRCFRKFLDDSTVVIEGCARLARLLEVLPQFQKRGGPASLLVRGRAVIDFLGAGFRGYRLGNSGCGLGGRIGFRRALAGPAGSGLCLARALVYIARERVLKSADSFGGRAANS